LDLSLNFGAGDSSDLIKMIQNSFKEEELKDDDKYSCDTCQKLSDLAIQRLHLEIIPENLIIILNRFEYNRSLQMRFKINTHVQLYEQLDFGTIFGTSQKMKGNSYDMYAIIVHSGVSAEAGHYYTFARDLQNNGVWILFNDKIVLKLKDFNIHNYFKENVSETPYMIFYQRQSSKINYLEEINKV